MAGAVSCSQPTLPMGSGDIIASVPMKLSLYGALIKFSSDPFGESRATWFVFSFLPCYVLFAVHCLQCSNSLRRFCSFCFCFSCWHHFRPIDVHFQDILFSSAYCWACEALPPQSASNVAVWRSKTRPDIGTSFRANFGFIRRCFHCIAPRICWSACWTVFDLLIQVTSLLGWCPLRRFKSARTRETQPECLKKSFSQIILTA